jgi:spore coat protein A, manganese oxidase
MRPPSRRSFLRFCAASVSASALSRLEAGAAESPRRTPAKLDRFIDPLPRLERFTPHREAADATEYRVRILEFEQPLHSQLPPTRLWGYEGHYPGPVFEARQGRPVRVRWENHLPNRHLFAIDTHIHGAMPPAPPVRTVPHLHGARTPSASDGLPEKWFTPGQSVDYFYPNQQPAATLWYHDHAIGITRLNAYAGLSGFYLLRDEEERRLNLPTGEYEIPLLLQDRTLDDGGQLVYRPTLESGQIVPNGGWGPEFFGDLPVVNGAIYPYLDVEPRAYRLRVVNAANSRFFRLHLNTAQHPTDPPALVPFHQIGSDGGLLPKAVPLNKLLLGPAERADLLVDFSKLGGKTVTLSNDASSPFPGWASINALHAPLYELMQFRVIPPHSGGSQAFSLPSLAPLPPSDDFAAAPSRDFVLTEKMTSDGRSLGVRINNKDYDEPVTEIVKLGSLERWRFINTTDDAHPMHVHLVQFRILERQGFDTGAFVEGRLRLTGELRPPADNEAGWKDTALVYPGEVLTIGIRFEGFPGRYVFHCHMLEHEDNDMMRPYEVIAGS